MEATAVVGLVEISMQVYVHHKFGHKRLTIVVRPNLQLQEDGRAGRVAGDQTAVGLGGHRSFRCLSAFVSASSVVQLSVPFHCRNTDLFSENWAVQA